MKCRSVFALVLVVCCLFSIIPVFAAVDLSAQNISKTVSQENSEIVLENLALTEEEALTIATLKGLGRSTEDYMNRIVKISQYKEELQSN